MAGGKGHLIGGFIFIIILLHTITHYFYRPAPLDLVLYVAIGLMFAVWPDVDIKSIGQKFFYSVFFLVDLFLVFSEEYKIAAFFGLIIILPILAKHRGWTHSRLTAVLLPTPLLLVPMYVFEGSLAQGIPYYFAAVTGYFSHLFFDKKLI